MRTHVGPRHCHVTHQLDAYLAEQDEMDRRDAAREQAEIEEYERAMDTDPEDVVLRAAETLSDDVMREIAKAYVQGDDSEIGRLLRARITEARNEIAAERAEKRIPR